VGDIDVDTALLRWQAISCDNGEQALSEVCQLIAPDVGNASSSCASVAAMFNDAATCLEQRTRELAARIRAVADDFDSNEGRSTVTIAASGEGGS